MKFNPVLLLVLFSIWTSNVAAGVSATDSSGHLVELPQPAVRIISLAPHTTEMIFAAGAGDKVVGVVSFSDYPQQALELPRVGGYQSLDYEAIIALKPDLILAWESGNPPTMIEKLKHMGYPVFVTEPRSFEDIPVLINSLSRLTGTRQIAEVAVNEFNEHLSLLRERYKGVRKLTVFYQIWRQPLMTVNSEHLINKVIKLCGGENIFDDLGQLAGTVGIESVLQRNPDMIIINGQGKRFQQWSADWAQWTQMKAVRNQTIFEVNPDIMSRHGPRILQGADDVCSILDRVRSKKTD